MFSSNSIKIFFAFAFLCLSSCSYWRGQTIADSTPAPYVVRELKSEIPFATKEPETYQTEIVITDGSGFEEKIFAAKNGANSLLIDDFQGKMETTLVNLSENRTFLVDRVRKVFAENALTPATASGGTLTDLVNPDLLNRQADANFENLGVDNALAKYRVTFSDSAASEIIIYFDEKIGLPVKQEFYSVAGDQKTLTSTIELKNFSAQVDAQLFEVPKGYRKVSLKEFHNLRKRTEKTK